MRTSTAGGLLCRCRRKSRAHANHGRIDPRSQRLSRLERACFGKDAWPFLDLVAVLTFADVVRLKAVEDGQMIGFVAGDPRPSDGLAWIATIGVAPEFRRRGIGRDLLRACEAQMKEPRLRLSVRASNDGAIRLYEQRRIRACRDLADLLPGRRSRHRHGKDPRDIRRSHGPATIRAFRNWFKMREELAHLVDELGRQRAHRGRHGVQQPARIP